MNSNKTLIAVYLFCTFLIAACGGGGGGSGGGGDNGNNGGNAPALADRYVISGNNDGTLSIFRNDPVAGFAVAEGYFETGAFSVQDMVYRADSGRLVLISSEEIMVLSFDAGNGKLELLDRRDTSGSSSHLAVNAAGTAAYVASGTSSTQTIDFYEIRADGTLSIAAPTNAGVDPDYIVLGPGGSRLYLVSRSDAQILVFDLDSNDNLVAGPGTINVPSNPTALAFSADGATAYLTRSNNSDNLIVYDVAANGGLSQRDALTQSNTPIDMVLSADGAHLYVLDSNNESVNHYSVDAATGEPGFVSSTNVSFVATDLALSPTGTRLHVSHSEDHLVSTLNVDPSDGSLTVVNWTRAFNSAQAIVSIAGNGALVPTAGYLLAPDETGISRFAIGTDGALTFDGQETSAGALIEGELAVDYQAGLLFGAGEDASQTDRLTSYRLDPATGAVTVVENLDATVPPDSSFIRIEVGRSGRFIYVLDEDRLDSATNQRGFIRAYAYAANGSITPTAIDEVVADQSPENLSLHPAGRFIYSINSFDDTISRFEINESDGTLSGGAQVTPGGTGSGNGRPIDLRFHPNGRYAYVSLEDDSQLIRYEVADSGALQNLSRTTLPQFNGNDVGPAPLAVHTNGRFLYVGEFDGISSGSISVLTINQTNYSLSFQERLLAQGNPSWIEIDPQGRFLYVRFRDGRIQVFGIDPATGSLTDTQQVEAAGNNAGFFPSLTLIAPLQ